MLSKIKIFFDDHLPRILLGIITLLIALLIILSAFYGSSNEKTSMKNLGVMAVKSMYNFGDINQLDDQMDVLKELTTDEVYQSLTIDRTDRTLRVYLKFNNKPSTVIIEKSTEDYVIYSLKTESISPTRKFTFYFGVNDEGKISYVREAEIVDFDTNITVNS